MEQMKPMEPMQPMQPDWWIRAPAVTSEVSQADSASAYPIPCISVGIQLSRTLSRR